MKKVVSGRVFHREELRNFTDHGIEEAVERGRSWVQRNFREWPYGFGLYYSIRTREGVDFVEFYFGYEDEYGTSD